MLPIRGLRALSPEVVSDVAGGYMPFKDDYTMRLHVAWGGE